MLRTALRPRWLALLVFVLLAATGMSLLGNWQLNRARDHGVQQATRQENRTPRPVEDVLAPRATFTERARGAHVTATGQWDGARRILLPGRELDGQRGLWVLVPLRLGDGSAIGVVRGWVPSATDPAAAPPAGRVTVTGLLNPTEPPGERAPGQGTGLPAGQLGQIAITDLIDRWPYPLITGYIAAETETVDGAPPAAGGLQRLPRPSAEAGLDWRNLGYAIQWWLFAGFGLFMWWRLVRDEYQTQQRRTDEPPAGDHTAPRQAQGVAP